jgi:cytochrome c biogenesis protein CcdA
MTNRHKEKYLTRMVAGFILVSGGIVVLSYTSLLKEKQEEWYIGVAASIVLVNSGLLFLCSAIVHKVKADLIRKQKQKDQQKKYEFE